MRENPIVATVDFDAEGVQHGYLRVPHSSNESAWGAVMIPIAVFRRGDGPTALLTGANHGDEFEGPIALYDFARKTEVQEMAGRVIVVPAMNYPAFEAASRLSPIDGKNLNRVFPGRPDGSLTEIIADYFSRVLLPMSNFVLDMHSGGKTLEFLPLAACHRLRDEDQESRCTAAMRAFGAPFDIKLLEMDPAGLYDTQVESMGKVFVTTELGGGGSVSPGRVQIAKRGVRNFLIHAGIFQGQLTLAPEGGTSLDMPDARSYVISEHAGLVDPQVALGDTVAEGDLLANVYTTTRTAVPPVEYRAPRAGLVLARHFPSRVATGDCLFVVAEILSRA